MIPSSPRTPTSMPFHLTRLAHRTGIILALGLLTWCSSSLITPTPQVFAQDDPFGDEEEEDDEPEQVSPAQIVILDIPLESTRTLAESLAELGDDVALYPQVWFEERVDEQGFDPEGLLSNRNAVSLVMIESDIDIIIVSRYSSKRERYTITFIPQDKTEDFIKFTVDASEDEGLTASGAAKIRRRLITYFKEKAQRDTPPEPVEDKNADDPNALRNKAIEEQKKKKSAGPKGAAKIAAGFRLIEPTLIFITAASDITDSLAITLGSSPGFALYAELFPMLFQDDADQSAKNFGVLLNYNQVFKSLLLSPTSPGQPPDMIAEPIATGTSYLDFEAGAFYNLDFGQGAQKASLRGKALLRIQRVSTSTPVSQFQTFRFLSIGLGADGIFPLSTSGAKLISSAEIAPFTSANPLPQEGIGTTRFAYTLSGSLGISYDFTPNLGFSGSYIYDNTRILFNKEQIVPPAGSTAPPVERAPKAVFSANGLFAGVHYIY